jgi:hypothetical protein
MTQKILAVLLAVLLLSSCSLRLVSEYDEVTDQGVSDLYRKTGVFLASLKKDVAMSDSLLFPGEVAERFYLDSGVAIGLLQTRAGNIEKNAETIEMLDVLEDALKDLEKVHRMGLSSVTEVQILQDTFDSCFRSILRLEQAKRRGKP